MRYPPRFVSNKEYESPLNEIRVSRGMTHKELAEKAKTNTSNTCMLANGTTSPLYERGKCKNAIKPWVARIAEVLNVDIEVLIPRYYCNIESPVNDSNLLNYFTIEQILINFTGLCTPKHNNELLLLFREATGKLTIRQKEVLLLHYHYGMSISEIAEQLEITSTRVRQIHNTAVGRIGQSSYRRRLELYKNSGSKLMVLGELKYDDIDYYIEPEKDLVEVWV